MDRYASSHSIIKALKGSSDPPEAQGPTKIEIASYAWRTPELFFPSKDEVLVDWILTTLLKDKWHGKKSRPLLSIPHWALLNEILASKETQRTSKIWLPLLLNRSSVSSIVNGLLTALQPLDTSEEELTNNFSPCILLLWTYAAPRMNIDTLMESFGSVISFLSFHHPSRLQGAMAAACLVVCRSFRQAFSNASNKKRIFTSFMEKYAEKWACLLCMPLRSEQSALELEINAAGVEILYSLDILKGFQDTFDTVMVQCLLHNQDKKIKAMVIPMLYRTYIREVRKHQSVIFSSGSKSSQEQTLEAKLRDIGLKAFETSYLALCGLGDYDEIAHSVVTLLEVVEQFNLVRSAHDANADILRVVAIKCLKTTTKSDAVQAITLQSLTILARIDFDLVQPLLKDIFQSLLLLGVKSHGNAQSLLREIVSFHTKSRSMVTYLAILMEAISGESLSQTAGQIPDSLQAAHRICLGSALLSVSHLEEVSRAVKGFLTPDQTLDAVKNIIHVLQTAWGTLSDGVHPDAMNFDELTTLLDRNNSKPRCSEMDNSSLTPRNLAGLTYSLAARFAAVFLPSLPFSFLSESHHSLVCSVIFEIRAKIAEKAITAPIFSVTRSWTDQIVSAATLRIAHALSTCPSLRPLDILELRAVSCNQIDAVIRSPGILPELVTELFRFFFDKVQHHVSPDEQRKIIGTLVYYLMTNLKVVDDEPVAKHVTWDGSSVSLCSVGSVERFQGALAIWHLLLERWLPDVDNIASSEEMKDIAGLYFRCFERSDVTGTPFSVNSTLERAMQSAAIWELPNFRDAVVSAIDKLSNKLDWTDTQKLLMQATSSSKQASTEWHQGQIKQVAAMFELLLRAPREYLPRTSKANVIQRAMNADLIICISCKQSVVDAVICQQAQTVIRTWLGSMIDFESKDFLPGHENHVAYISYLIAEPQEVDKAYQIATLDLISQLQRCIIRSAERGSEDLLKGLCLSLSKMGYDLLSSMAGRCLLTFFDNLNSELPDSSKLSQDCIKSIKIIYGFLMDRCSPAMVQLASGKNSLDADGAVIQAYAKCLTLKRWLADYGELEFHGESMLRKLASSTTTRTPCAFGTQLLALLLQEYHFTSPEGREKHLSLIVSSYVLMIGIMDVADASECDAALATLTKSLSKGDFEFILSFLREAMGGVETIGSELRTVVHLSSVFTGNSPEGVLKAIQEHFEECLRIFLINEARYLNGDVELTSDVLYFIASMCSDKPAYLRPLSLGPIWAILSRILNQSKTHTMRTHYAFLNSITSIIGALIRLRRDLVRSTLPHLGLVLRLLIRSLPAPRAQLGARQRTLVSDTFPWWLTPSEPARPAEVRAVARLLTTMQAKTVPRTFTFTKGVTSGAGDGDRKAESLAGAFSKHAAPVLAAYIEILGDPLLVLTPAMREALAPGLYALCDMMSEHGRDALMASGLDATGRAAMKVLWREYEKQRYVGKG